MIKESGSELLLPEISRVSSPFNARMRLRAATNSMVSTRFEEHAQHREVMLEYRDAIQRGEYTSLKTIKRGVAGAPPFSNHAPQTTGANPPPGVRKFVV